MSTTTAPAKAQPKAMTAKDRKAIQAERVAGVTLAELRKAWPQYTSEQIRDVLPPANAREAKARTAKAQAAAANPGQPPTTTELEAQGYSGSGAVADPPKVQAPNRASFAKGAVGTRKFNTAVAQFEAALAAEAKPAAAPKATKPKVERKPIDPKLATKAVTMRGKLDDKGRPASWAKIGYSLKLVPEGAPKSQAGDAARRAYRQIKGSNAPTGPSDY